MEPLLWGWLKWLLGIVPSAILGEYAEQWWFRGPLKSLKDERDALASELRDTRGQTASLEILFLKLRRVSEAALQENERLVRENDQLKGTVADLTARLDACESSRVVE